jgi:hypothetical protein
MNKLGRLVKLARIVRQAFEKLEPYNSDLRDCCYRASVQLVYLAQKEGIPAEIGTAPGHVFVLLGNTIVDVTATQFGKRRKVVVGDLRTLISQTARGCTYVKPWELQNRISNLQSLKDYGWHKTSRSDRRAVLAALKGKRD